MSNSEKLTALALTIARLNPYSTPGDESYNEYKRGQIELAANLLDGEDQENRQAITTLVNDFLNPTKIDWSDSEKIAELLVGRTVTVEGNNLVLDNGKVLKIEPTSECCSNYSLIGLHDTQNVITRAWVQRKELNNPNYDRYELFVLTGKKKVNLAQVEGTPGTGWYSTGFSIVVTI